MLRVVIQARKSPTVHNLSHFRPVNYLKCVCLQSATRRVRFGGGSGVVSDRVQVPKAAAATRDGGQRQEAAGAGPSRAESARAGEEPRRSTALCCVHREP